ncbi:MAG: AtpZ/AtpI family protein [Anaerolineae bacterium]|nr:AtpZ/AtpI family protein [Anaerolineae bacterium]
MLHKHPFLAFAFHLAWLVTLSAFIPLALGVWADYHWGTAPWLTLAGMVVGGVMAIASIVRSIWHRFTMVGQGHNDLQGRGREGET